MDIKKTILQHKQICTLVSEKRIKLSLDILADMLTRASSGYLRDEYDNVVMTYRHMLTYTIEGINDPERNKVYLKLIQSIRTADKVRQELAPSVEHIWIKQRMKKSRSYPGRLSFGFFDDLMFKSELDEWLRLSNEINPTLNQN